MVRQIITSLRSCRSGHWEYCIVIIFPTFKASWKAHQVSRFWRQELNVCILLEGFKSLNTLRPRQNGRRFADDTLKRIFLNENVIMSINISLKFVPKGPINNNPALVQIMAWHQSGDKPLSEPMMVSLLTHICVTRPQWVNELHAPCLHDMFKNNDTPSFAVVALIWWLWHHDDVRATKLEQPLRRTTNYGLRTFSYIGSRLWNLLVQEYLAEVPHMDLGQFKSLLKQWTGPKCDVSEMYLL